MGIWSRAREIAAATPANRNRYVDFLRAVSILFVITGHWLITTAYNDPATGTLGPVRVLEILPWTAWLTWLFQVMPIFFIVGGYSNAVSLESARRSGTDYAQWLAGRLHRLLTPLLALVLFWGVLTVYLLFLGHPQDIIRVLSRAALVPTWFLAIYTMIVLLAPATYALWRRWGYLSLAVFAVLAVLTDAAFFLLHWEVLGWTNYFWVWLATHHLGFAWRDGRMGSPPVLLILAAVSLLLLVILIQLGPYPIAMAGSPGSGVSNTLPPKITLLALGVFQFGLLLAMEKPMQRLLDRPGLWTATVLINSMIMTIYLWHMTVMLGVMAASYFSGGIGFNIVPGSTDWWLSRPLWLLLLSALLLPVALLLAPLERLVRPASRPIPSRFRLILGAVTMGLGISIATLRGFSGDLLSAGHLGTLLLVLGGAWISGLSLPRPGITRNHG